MDKFEVAIIVFILFIIGIGGYAVVHDYNTEYLIMQMNDKGEVTNAWMASNYIYTPPGLVFTDSEGVRRSLNIFGIVRNPSPEMKFKYLKESA